MEYYCTSSFVRNLANLCSASRVSKSKSISKLDISPPQLQPGLSQDFTSALDAEIFDRILQEGHLDLIADCGKFVTLWKGTPTKVD